MQTRRWWSLILLIAAPAFVGAQTSQAHQAIESSPSQGAPLASGHLYRPISPEQRFQWFVHSTVGPQTLGVGVLSAAWGTAFDRPKEYGPHWDGFAKRYGMRLTGVSTGNAMEASLGTIWGEDPRYFRTYDKPFSGRVKNVIAMTFLAHNREGVRTPAYARYMATAGNNFLSNTWRADSEATTRAAMLRTLYGFLGLMAKNAFAEFWPDAKAHLRHHSR